MTGFHEVRFPDNGRCLGMIETPLYVGPLHGPDLQIIAPFAEDPRIGEIGRRLNREWGAAMGYSVSETVAWCRTLPASQTEALMIATRSRRAVGAAILAKCDLPSRDQYSPWLSSLLVHPQERGRGTGTALAFSIIDAAHQKGHENIYLYARAGQLVRFYECIGFFRLEPLTIDGDGFWIMQRSTTPT